MSPGTITAIAYLLTEALLAGVEMSRLLVEIRATGKVSDDEWARIMADLKQAQADWDVAPGP